MEHFVGKIIENRKIEIEDLSLEEIKDYFIDKIRETPLSKINYELFNFSSDKKIYLISIYKDFWDKKTNIIYWIECENKEEAKRLLELMAEDELYSF